MSRGFGFLNARLDVSTPSLRDCACEKVTAVIFSCYGDVYRAK
jgi:hypothetical protein